VPQYRAARGQSTRQSLAATRSTGQIRDAGHPTGQNRAFSAAVPVDEALGRISIPNGGPGGEKPPESAKSPPEANRRYRGQMRNQQLFIQLWSALTALLGLVVIGCDVSLTRNLADALVSQPKSLQDDGTVYTIILLVAGVLLFAGGIIGLVLATARSRRDSATAS
jgi:hypothetical protein